MLFFAETGAVDHPARAPAETIRVALAVSRVFVTGASGYTGGAVSTRLLERGEEVVALASSDAATAKLDARGSRSRGVTCWTRIARRRHDGVRARLPLAGVNSHCPPDPNLLFRVNARGPRPPCGPPHGPASRASSTPPPRRRWGSPPARSAMSTPSTAAPTYPTTSAPSARASRRRSRPAPHGVEVWRPARRRSRGRAGRRATASSSSPTSTEATGVRRHLGQRRRHRRLHRGHLLAAERGRDGARYVLNGATISSAQALDLITSLSGVQHTSDGAAACRARGGRGGGGGR